MDVLIQNIITTISKLKNGISKEDRDNLEFDIQDMNYKIGTSEHTYDTDCIKLEKDKDAEYKIQKEAIKTDASMKRHLDSKFIERQLLLDKQESDIKYCKRLHSGFIRVAEHVKGSVIQENVDAKRIKDLIG